MLRHSLLIIGSVFVPVSSVLAQAPSEPTPRVPIPGGCEPGPGLRFDPAGLLQAAVIRVNQNWLTRVAAGNPALMAMFRDRDRPPYRDLLPWSGEFFGKHLTGAALMLDLLAGPEDRGEREQLLDAVKPVVAEVLAHQDADGYLGPFPRANRLTGNAPNVGEKGGPTWDAWGHYHAMLGLLLWHERTGDPDALSSARKIGDLFCERFLGADRSPRLVDTGSTEMNLAPAHALCLLFEQTGEPSYRDLAIQLVEKEFAATNAKGEPLAGDYLRRGLAGEPFYKIPKPRWESLHPMMALPELYRITGDAKYRTAFENLWWSIVETDRHNNGGFSSGEQAQGNPYHQGAIETCCTVAWMAMTVEMLHLNADSRIADELELSLVNSGLAMWHPSGAWSTYNTPMDGTRKANYHDIVFQARPGSPQLNCCSVNAPRSFGLLGQWAFVRDADGLVLNWYGDGTAWERSPGHETVGLRIEGGYPREGRVKVTVLRDAAGGEPFTLKLRIPSWSRATTVSVNGAAVPEVTPGRYLPLTRNWSNGDVIELGLDMTPHAWVGEKESAGRVSLYRGPVLLTFDCRDNPDVGDDPTTLDLEALEFESVDPTPIEAISAVRVRAADGSPLLLRDFATAGADGTSYRSWLRALPASPIPFDRAHPLRSQSLRSSR